MLHAKKKRIWRFPLFLFFLNVNLGFNHFSALFVSRGLTPVRRKNNFPLPIQTFNNFSRKITSLARSSSIASRILFLRNLNNTSSNASRVIRFTAHPSLHIVQPDRLRKFSCESKRRKCSTHTRFSSRIFRPPSSNFRSRHTSALLFRSCANVGWVSSSSTIAARSFYIAPNCLLLNISSQSAVIRRIDQCLWSDLITEA